MLLNLDPLNETQLQRLGPAAVPQLVAHLTHPRGDCRRALYALQYCWSDAAVGHVAALLTATSSELRRMAAIVLDRQVGREQLARLCAQHVEHPDAAVAGFCLEHAEVMLPAVDRAAYALQRPALWPRIARYLPRYQTTQLTAATRALLGAEPMLVRAALVALIAQNDRTQATRAQVSEILTHADPACREAAAEYLAWHGSVADIAILERATLGEQDVHAVASMCDALTAIARRRDVSLPSERHTQTSVVPNLDPLCTYAEATAALEHAAPGSAAWDRAWRSYAEREDFEPHWLFGGQPPPVQFLAERAARYALQARLFALPNHDPISEVSSEPTPCAALVAPTRDTLLDTDDGFGVFTKSDDRAFKQLVHVGDDVSWYQDHGSVLALADGCVRAVRAQASWGHWVIVEHRFDLAAGGDLREAVPRFVDEIGEEVVDAHGYVRMCSLYGHLGPFVRVRPGMHVLAGTKLGTIGRSFTWENGGYPAHVHLGLHLGPYQQTPQRGRAIDINFNGERYRGRVVTTTPDEVVATIRYRGNPAHVVHRSRDWQCGYVARWYWHSRAHGWVGVKQLLRAWRSAQST